MNTLLRRLRDERGFTLVELITTMGILMVVLGGITALFVSGSRAQADLDRRFQAQTQLRVGLDRLRKDIHSACSAYDASTAQPLANNATPSSIDLKMPTPSTGCTAPTDITWCAQASGTHWWKLVRSVTANCTGAIRLANYLTNSPTDATHPIFKYYSYNQPAGSYSLARLHVYLQANVQGGGHGTYVLEDDVVFRNSPRCTVGTDCP